MAPTPPHSGDGAAVPQNGQGRLYDEAILGREARSTSLREWIGLLWSGKWIILGVVVLALGLAWYHVASVPAQYRTSTLLHINRDDGQQIQLGGRSSFLRRDNTLSNELFLLSNSNVIAERVARRLLRLQRHPTTGNRLSLLNVAYRDSVSAIASRVRSMTRVYSAGPEGVDALRIQATSREPDEAALVANLYAEAYIAHTKERSRESMQASRQFLEKQVKTMEQDVNAADRRIQEYMQREGAVALDQASSRIVQKISDLEARRDELRIELDMKQKQLERLQDELGTAETQVVQRLSSSLNERLERVQTEKAELEMQIDQVKQRNPSATAETSQYLRRMNQRLARLETKADSLAQVFVDQALEAGAPSGTAGVDYVMERRRRAAQLRFEMDGLQAQLDLVNRRLSERRAELEEVPEKSIEIAQLQRERRSAEQIYGFVREKLQEVRLREESEVGFAEVVQPAQISRVPIGPDLQQNLILALLFGFGLGTGIVVVWTKLDTRIYEPDDIKAKGYPMAGIVPSMDALIRNEFGGAESIELDGQDVPSELVMLTSPMSAAAEAYRRIRTNLRFARPDQDVHTIAVTSAEMGEGKTTTASNLALALASAGKDTVLIDTDLRNPRLHRLFDRRQEPGLSQLLFDDSPPPTEAFATGIDHLSVIPVGESVPNPAEMLGSRRMKELIDDLARQHDIVLCDTPPVLLFSDALALASHCDGSLVVASAGSSDGRALDHAAEQVEDVGSALLGCILNRYEGGTTLYGYGYNYGYARGYRQLDEYYQQGAAEPKTGFTGWWNG